MNKMDDLKDLVNISKLNELLNKKEAEALDKKVKKSGLRGREESFQSCLGIRNYRNHCRSCSSSLRNLSFLCTGLFRGFRRRLRG